MQGAGFRDQDSGCRVQGLGCRIHNSGFRDLGSGSGVETYLSDATRLVDSPDGNLPKLGFRVEVVGSRV